MILKFKIKTKFDIGDIVTLKNDPSFISEIEDFYFDYGSYRKNSYANGNFYFMYKTKAEHRGNCFFPSEALKKVDKF
jgi:hypothetical protein